MTRTLIYQGSVKDLYRDGDEMDFVFSDRYSIYDWGEMPDAIPHKGAALVSLAASFFEYLQQRGLQSHYLRQGGPRTLSVQAVQVLRPDWHDGRYDYAAYQSRPQHTLVPLEVIFRRRLALGNSLQRRLAANPAYLQDLGLQQMPDGGTVFEPPLVELSTKLESTDRYLGRRELAAMDLLSDAELEQLLLQTRTTAEALRELFESLGISLWDGKFEYAWAGGSWPRRELLLVDSIGPDELRLSYGGLPLSKEFLRQIHVGTPWLRAVQEAKALARARQTPDWKAICTDELKQHPDPLGKAQLEAAALLYQALANEVAAAVGRERPFAADCTLARWHGLAQELEHAT